jgi:predicted PurR-regulated permease PerM
VNAPTPAIVPGWLVRAAAVGWRVLVTVGAALVVVLVAYLVPVSTTATLVSLVVAAALAPTAIRLRERGLPRQAAAAITFGAGAVLIVIAAIVVLVALLGDLRTIAGAVDLGLERLRAELTGMGAPAFVSGLIDQVAESSGRALTPDVAGLVGTIGNVATVLVLGTFLTYFLLADGDRGWAWLMRSLRPWQAAAVRASAERGVGQVAWYIRRTALLATLDGVVIFVVLGLAGIPFAGALAAVAFIAGFVPYLGAVAGGAIIALSAFAIGGPVVAIASIAALVVTWIVATRLLEGTAMNSSVDVHPVVVLVALPTGVALFGILGLLALLPITVFGRAVGRSVVAALDIAPPAGEPTDAASASGGPDGAVPLWLDRVAQWSWRALVLAALAALAIGLVVRIPGVVVPAVIAVVGAATLRPLVDRLQVRGWTPSAASAGATLGAVAFIVGSVVLAVGLTLGSLRDVVAAAAAGAAQLDLAWLRDLVSRTGSDLEVDVAGLVGDTVGLGIALLLALLMTFFFLRDGSHWWAALLVRLAPGRRAPVELAGSRGGSLLAGYMIGTAVISGFGALTTGLVLVLLGLPLAIPIMVISFFAGFIPYIGSFISTILATLVTAALGTTTDLVVMFVFTIVFNIVQGNFVTPLVYGKSLSLHPAVVLMAIPLGNEIAGILGMFLVVPVAAVVAATWRLVPAVIDGSGLPPEPVTPDRADPDPAQALAPAPDVQT